MSLGIPPKKARRKLNSEELKALEGYSAVRLPMEHCATLLGMSKDTLERMYKKDAATRAAIDGGRSKASGNVRKTLFSLAMGRPARHEKVRDKDGNEHMVLVEPAVPTDFQALKFWCQTQEGFKTASSLELGGKDGAPLTGIVVQIVEPKTEND